MEGRKNRNQSPPLNILIFSRVRILRKICSKEGKEWETKKGEYKRKEGEIEEKERRKNKSGWLISIWSVARRGTSVYTGSCLYRLVYSSKLLFYRVSLVIRLSCSRIWDCPRPFAGPSRVSTWANGIHTLMLNERRIDLTDLEDHLDSLPFSFSSFFFSSCWRDNYTARERFSSLGFDKWRIAKAIGGGRMIDVGPSEDDRVRVAVNGVKFEEISFLEERVGRLIDDLWSFLPRFPTLLEFGSEKKQQERRSKITPRDR